jgi:hypothetical protein
MWRFKGAQEREACFSRALAAQVLSLLPGTHEVDQAAGQGVQGSPS